MRSAAALLALLALAAVLAAHPAGAVTVIGGLAPTGIAIGSSFEGTELTVFGTIATDAGDVVARPFDVVVTLTGPERDMVVRRREPVGGLWINRDHRRIGRVPSFSAIASTRPLGLLADPPTADRLGRRIEAPTSSADPRTAAFDAALERLERRRGRWIDRPTGVSFLGGDLFAVRLPLPADAPVGRWRVHVEVFSDGRPLAETTAPLIVAKSGFEQRIADLAGDRPVLYGLLAVATALLTGWLGGVLFRRD
jgi:uncharacterized protein (TIGR02186 family)